jgi:hypothetical protein
VFKLARAPEGIELLRWNKKLPSASSQDPLGLNLRVSARLAGELLHCITSITPRARHHSFAWAFQTISTSPFDGELAERRGLGHQ